MTNNLFENNWLLILLLIYITTKCLSSSDIFIDRKNININPFDVYVEYTRREKVAFICNLIYSIEYTCHVVKNLHLLLK